MFDELVTPSQKRLGVTSSFRIRTAAGWVLTLLGLGGDPTGANGLEDDGTPRRSTRHHTLGS